MPITGKLFRKMQSLPDDIRSVLLDLVDEMDNSVKKEDFKQLKNVVQELAEAQKVTEKRLDSLTIKVEELAEAQKVTEKRLDSLTIKVEELAEAQKRTEQRVEELAEAQKRTEKRVEELAEAQKRTEQRVEELAEAQKKTEESLNKLTKRVDNIEVQLGGLSMAVGYGIEDKLYPHLEKFAEKVFDVVPMDVVLRKNIVYADGRFDELNVYIKAKKDGKQVLIIGESKAQPGKKDIDKFIKTVERVEKYTGTVVYPFIVGYSFSPIVEKYINEKYPKLKFFNTYQIEHGKY